MSFTAQDVKALRESTGAGMMDCKKALEESSGDIEAAKQYLREKGLAASAKRDDRENNQGLVALGIDGSTAAMVQLKCETDFVAGSEHFLNEAAELLKAVMEGGADSVTSRETQLEELRILLKEKIELGEIVHMVAATGNTIGHYEHTQGGRGVNGVLVEMTGASDELAHDIAVHIAFARPRYLNREDVPSDVVATERSTLETITRNEGKPEQAIEKIVEGRIGGFFKDVCLLEQPFAKDDKQSIQQVIGSAGVVRFAQVEIG
ncbi:MAG: translation elongation factor Ts [Acidimicrobiaceae bacterium]|nr:translation elongation factor Ts [Acidimicrobiaceae bacterium]HBU75056.1 translation elongation factor Ts [Acidimicrobiaceae bacterium]|tara:strand:+ start:177 stop:965 length:789 start_codon:yes stop_codon:yes gene_type:complete